MLRRTMAAVLAIALIAFAGAAMAQTCVLGAYMDTAGTQGYHEPVQLQPFTFYVVMHVESTVAGVAYTIQVPDHIVGPIPVSYGPSGHGLNVFGPSGGLNVGLGECAIGFNNQPIVIATYTAFTEYGPVGPTQITLGPNIDEDATYPVFADCADQLIVCGSVSHLELGAVSTDAASFGAVKSLYGN